jgi:hypothetical protein
MPARYRLSRKAEPELVCHSGRPRGAAEVVTAGLLAAISDFLTAMPEKRLPFYQRGRYSK